MPMPAAKAPARNHRPTGRTRVRPRAFAEREMILEADTGVLPEAGTASLCWQTRKKLTRQNKVGNAFSLDYVMDVFD